MSKQDLQIDPPRVLLVDDDASTAHSFYAELRNWAAEFVNTGLRPSKEVQGIDLFYRVRLQSVLALALLIMVALWFPTFILPKCWSVVVIFSVCWVLALLLLLLLRSMKDKARWLPVVSNSYIAILIVFITTSNWMSGGLSGGNITAFLIIPFVAVCLLGTWGLPWILVTFGIMGVFQYCMAVGYPIPNVIPEEHRVADMFMTWAFVFLLMTAGTFQYESARKSAVRQLIEAKDRAERADRSKSQFLANMSHEIRTPMNGVMGMLELLTETELSGKQRHFAETARSSGESLLRIINDILDFSKIEAGRLELESVPFDLQDSVEEAVVLLAEKAHSKGLEIACHMAPDVPVSLRGDPMRLRQILTNLVGNAIKFTEEGEVVVRAHCLQQTQEEALLRFEVFDTGIGVSPEYRQRIFDVFSQEDESTTRRFGGTGLGLAISRQLCELMGGQIGLESQLEKGSTFWFTIRLQKGAEEKQTSRTSPGTLRDLRVLIVDDNKTNREILNHQVVSWGMRNGSTSGGPRALELLHRAIQEGDPYDVVILDFHMPGMDGLQVARAMEQDQALRGTRRIILTSVDQNIREQEMRQAGIAAWLTKPVRSSQLYDCLASVMKGVSPKEASRELEPAVAQKRFDAQVLLAEDNPVNQEVARSMLETLGCRVQVVADGLEALEAVSHETFDLILMDCQMPRMDGYEATRILKQGQSPPVIALTAHAMDGDREQCLSAGMDDYLSKPFSREQLLEVLQRWLSQSSTEQPAAPAALQPQTLHRPASIDPKVLDTIRSLQQPGNPDLLERVIRIYLEDSLRLLGELKEARAQGELPRVKRTAHTLKSSSANVGAMRLSALCKELEGLDLEHAVERLQELLSQIESEYQIVQTELNQELLTVQAG